MWAATLAEPSHRMAEQRPGWVQCKGAMQPSVSHTSVTVRVRCAVGHCQDLTAGDLSTRGLSEASAGACLPLHEPPLRLHLRLHPHLRRKFGLRRPPPICFLDNGTTWRQKRMQRTTTRSIAHAHALTSSSLLADEAVDGVGEVEIEDTKAVRAMGQDQTTLRSRSATRPLRSTTMSLQSWAKTSGSSSGRPCEGSCRTASALLDRRGNFCHIHLSRSPC